MEEPALPLYCRTGRDGLRFKVHLTPRSATEGLTGLHGDALKVKVKAPPVDGRANEALVKFLTRTFGLRSGAIEVVSGHSSRNKMVRVEGLTREAFMSRLADLIR
ncbi:MAG: YggU family protein [Proteobacteria bacterium]|nr:YggU family protein [Pseudomonadota bacterium]